MWCYKSLGKSFVKRHGEIKEDEDLVVKKKHCSIHWISKLEDVW